MNGWGQFAILLSNSNVISFLISMGASITWDAVKATVNASHSNKSFECLCYELVAETFKDYYGFHELEYDESIVMDAFLEQVRTRPLPVTEEIAKQIIENTIGLVVDKQNLFYWAESFKRICAQDKYQQVYRKIILDQFIATSEDRDFSWMEGIMDDNCCNIKYSVFEKVIPSLEEIETTLNAYVWSDIKVLIWEVLFNAQQHGKATKCSITVETNRIILQDNGMLFDPLQLRSGDCHGGCSLSLKQITNEYPEIEIRSKNSSGFNNFEIVFDESVFNVNRMSEIIVPSLMICTNLEFLYSDGTFKYYFIDIGQTDKNSEFSGASFSAVIRYLGSLSSLTNNGVTKKIFIYFPNFDNVNIEIIYKRFQMILSERRKAYENIVLIH